MKKIIAAIILLALFAAGTVSCAENGKTKISESSASLTDITTPSVTTDKEDTTKILDVPNDLDYGGREIQILQRTSYTTEMFASKYTSELINDTIYERNKRVEDYLNVKLKFNDRQGTNTDPGNYYGAVVNARNSDTEEYHIVANYAYFGVTYASQDLFHDYTELEVTGYINPDKIWWNQSYKAESTINGKYYFLVGDTTISAINRLEVAFVNLTLADDNFDGVNFFDIVNNYEFTYDYFLQLSRSVATEEISGVTMPMNSTSIDGLLAAMQITFVQRDSRGVPALNINTDRNRNVAVTLRDLYQTETSAFASESTGAPLNTFKAGNALFHLNLMQFAGQHFTTVTFDWAILPMPMWDSEQNAYYPTAHDEYSSLSVVKNVSESLEATTAVLETMSYFSWKDLRPALYEKAYKGQYLGTAPKAQLFDLIIDNSFFDFGYIYSKPIGNALHAFRNFVRYPANDSYTEHVAANFGAIASKLEEFLTSFY